MPEAVETPWGVKEPYVYDPGGSLAKFGQVTDRSVGSGRDEQPARRRNRP